MRKLISKIFAAVSAVPMAFVSAVSAQTTDNGTTTGQVLGATTNNNNGLLWIVGLLVLAAIVGLILFILANRNKDNK